MCNKEISVPPFPIMLLGFSLTALSTLILGQIRSVCLAAALVLSVVKLKTSYKSFLDDIVYSTTFGTFIGATLGQVYKEEPLTWIMLTIFFILVWWAKESKYDEQNSEYVKWFTVCWASVETATAIFRVESYLLKVLLTSAISACVTYCVLRWMKKTYQEVLTYTVYVSAGTAALGLFIWWLVNLCLGRGLLPDDDTKSYGFVIAVIFLMFFVKIYGVRDEYMDEMFQKCFVAIMIVLPNIIALIVHPILLVLLVSVSMAIYGYKFHSKQNELAVKSDKKLKNNIYDYVLGPLYLFIALGLMVWIFKNFMEPGCSNMQGSSIANFMEDGVTNMKGSSIEEFMETEDSNMQVSSSGDSMETGDLNMQGSSSGDSMEAGDLNMQGSSSGDSMEAGDLNKQESSSAVRPRKNMVLLLIASYYCFYLGTIHTV